MSELYPIVRFVHIAAVAASGALFLLRGGALFSGAGWPLAAPTRYLSYAIDSVLLAAALTLMTMVRQYPFVHAWLSVKVLLLAVYIVLGFMAFWRGRGRALRMACWLAAMAVYGFIVSVAVMHSPLGLLGALARP